MRDIIYVIMVLGFTYISFFSHGDWGGWVNSFPTLPFQRMRDIIYVIMVDPPYHALRVSLPFQVDRMLGVGFQERMTGFLVPAGN